MRFNASVDLNQESIVKALRAVGAQVEIIGRPVDLLVGYERRTYLMEVKQPKGRLQPHQEEFLRKWPGDVATTIRSIEEALSTIGCETRGVEIGPRRFSSHWLDGNSDGGTQ